MSPPPPPRHPSPLRAYVPCEPTGPHNVSSLTAASPTYLYRASPSFTVHLSWPTVTSVFNLVMGWPWVVTGRAWEVALGVTDADEIDGVSLQVTAVYESWATATYNSAERIVTLSGTPPAPGNYTFLFQVTDPTMRNLLLTRPAAYNALDVAGGAFDVTKVEFSFIVVSPPPTNRAPSISPTAPSRAPSISPTASPMFEYIEMEWTFSLDCGALSEPDKLALVETVGGGYCAAAPPAGEEQGWWGPGNGVGGPLCGFIKAGYVDCTQPFGCVDDTGCSTAAKAKCDTTASPKVCIPCDADSQCANIPQNTTCSGGLCIPPSTAPTSHLFLCIGTVELCARCCPATHSSFE